LANELAAQDATQTGGTVWAWKGLSRTPGSCWCARVQHSSYQTTSNGTPGKGNPRRAPSPNDRQIPSRLRYLARVWPVATAGRLGAYSFDPATGSFAMVATAPGGLARGGKATDTVVSIPATVRGSVQVSGAAVLAAVVTRPDGSRMAYVTPTVSPSSDAVAPLPYIVTVGPASAALRAEVASAAATPPAPIAEPQARTMAIAALEAQAQSPNASVRSTAQLIQGLAGIVLGTTDPNG
jgi:hypothetical protein